MGNLIFYFICQVNMCGFELHNIKVNPNLESLAGAAIFILALA
jgi:hypothetical protein